MDKDTIEQTSEEAIFLEHIKALEDTIALLMRVLRKANTELFKDVAARLKGDTNAT